MTRVEYGIYKCILINDPSESMNIHPGLMSKLKIALMDALRSQRVSNGLFLDFETSNLLSELDNNLPHHGPLRETLVEMVDDAPLSHFVSGWIHERLSSDDYIENDIRPLETIPSFENIEEVAECILNDFKRLPFKYRLTTPLPPDLIALLDVDEEITISDRVRILRSGPSQNAKLSLSTGDAEHDAKLFGLGLLGLGHPRQLDGAYLQLDVDGYVGRFMESNPRRKAHDLVRSFLGISIALGIFQKGSSWRPQYLRRHVYVHRHAQEGWSFQHKGELDLAASTLIDKLEMMRPKELDVSPFFARKYLELGLNDLAKAFKNPDEAEQVFLAAQWLFDSYAAENELLAFVQAMVCLEIIFGDKATSNKTGLGELLRNRCAYLIGKTATQRAEILAEFGKIYDVRSAIVHRGKSRITREERSLFYTLRWYCARAIQEEIRLIGA